MKFTIHFSSFLAGVYFASIVVSIGMIAKGDVDWGISLVIINTAGLFFNSFVMVKK